jgi:hypothetical protein
LKTLKKIHAEFSNKKKITTKNKKKDVKTTLKFEHIT